MNVNKSKVLPRTVNRRSRSPYNRLNLDKINGTSCYSHNQCIGRTLDKFYCGNDRTCKMCPKDILNKRMFLVNRDTIDGVYPLNCGNVQEIACESNENCAPGNYCSKSNFGQVCAPCQACSLYNDGIDGNCGYRCAPAVRVIQDPQASNEVQLEETTYNYNYHDTPVENSETQPIADITSPFQYTTEALPPTTEALPLTTAALPPTTAALPPTTAALPITTAALPPTMPALPPTMPALPPTTAALPPTMPALPPTMPVTTAIADNRY